MSQTQVQETTKPARPFLDFEVNDGITFYQLYEVFTTWPPEVIEFCSAPGPLDDFDLGETLRMGIAMLYSGFWEPSHQMHDETGRPLPSPQRMATGPGAREASA